MATSSRVEEIDFHGWSAIRLTNGLITAVAVPELGGRIMSLRLGSHEYLFMNKALAGKRFTPEEHQGDGSLIAWKNYGGAKTWPAPQGWDRDDQWPGPPDPILDSGQYDYETRQQDDAAILRMISPPDRQHTGLRIHRQFTLKPRTTILRLKLTFENITNRPTRWAIWDVAQMACAKRRPDGEEAPNTDCWVYISTRPDMAAAPPYQILYGEQSPQWQAEIAPGVMGAHYLGHVGKIGVASPGWLAFADQLSGYVFSERFAYEPGAEYPDGGASVEVWTESPGAPSPVPIKSPGYLLEVEVLGPIRTLQPGETTTLELAWGSAYCPGPVTNVGEMGCVHRPLRITQTGSWATVQGTFGCFIIGQAELVWLSQAGDILERTQLQASSPLSVLCIDRAVPLPAGAARAELVLADQEGTVLGRLDEAAIG